MDSREEAFAEALKGKKIPILTLDNKWYRLFEPLSDEKQIKDLEENLNNLLKRQGKLNTESVDIKKLKKKLMNEIVPMVDAMDQGASQSLGKKIDEHKRLVNECNEKLEAYQDELLDLPREIERVNFKLMLATMDYCYERMEQYTEDITEIAAWVASVRVELKKNLIRKQEMEQRNHAIYSYMHDIFGADVIELFDMKYNPEEQHPKRPVLKAVEPSKQEEAGQAGNTAKPEQAAKPKAAAKQEQTAKPGTAPKPEQAAKPKAAPKAEQAEKPGTASRPE